MFNREKNKAKRTKIESFLFGVGLFAMGFFLAVVNAPQVINTVDLLNNGIETTAVITNIRRVGNRAGGGARTYSFTLELDYFVGDVLYQNEIGNFSETNFNLVVGQEISIQFSPNNHTNILTSNRLNEPVMIFLMPVIFLVTSGGLMIVGLLCIVGKLKPFEEKYKITNTLRPELGLPVAGGVIIIIGIVGFFHGRGESSIFLIIMGLVTWLFYINNVVIIKDDHFTYRLFPKKLIYYKDIKTIQKVKKENGDATGKYRSFSIVLKNGKELRLRGLKYLENLDNAYQGKKNQIESTSDERMDEHNMNNLFSQFKEKLQSKAGRTISGILLMALAVIIGIRFRENDSDVITGIIVTIVGAGFSRFISFGRDESEGTAKERSVLRIETFWIKLSAISFLAACFFSFFAIRDFLDPDFLWTSVETFLVVVIAIFGFILPFKELIRFLNRAIIIHDDHFVIRNWLRNVRVIYYQDVKKYDEIFHTIDGESVPGRYVILKNENEDWLCVSDFVYTYNLEQAIDDYHFRHGSSSVPTLEADEHDEAETTEEIEAQPGSLRWMIIPTVLLTLIMLGVIWWLGWFDYILDDPTANNDDGVSNLLIEDDAEPELPIDIFIPDHELQVTMPWSLTWTQETIQLYPEQELELERRIDWHMQEHLHNLYGGMFTTADRALVTQTGFDFVDLTYYRITDSTNPVAEPVNIRLHLNWIAPQLFDEPNNRIFLAPHIRIQINIPYEREYALARIAEDEMFYRNLEMQLNILTISLLNQIYAQYDTQLINFTNNHLRERQVDNVIISILDQNSGVIDMVQIMPVWDRDEFGVFCWDFYWPIESRMCD